MPTLNHYLVLSAILFSIGTAGVFLRRNLITILLSIEIMLNAGQPDVRRLRPRARHRRRPDHRVLRDDRGRRGSARLGLAIVIALFRHRESLEPRHRSRR